MKPQARMSQERGILGLKKDPKHQLLFMFRVPAGEEWPSSDSEDDDYTPETKTGPDDDTGDSSDERPHNNSPNRRGSKVRGGPKAEDSNTNNNARRAAGRKQRPKKRTHDRSSPDGLSVPKRQKKGVRSRSGASSSTSSENKPRNSQQTCRLQAGDYASDDKVSQSFSSVPSLPQEIWMQIFQCAVDVNGPLPFLCRASKVCQSWREMASDPTLWHKVDLSYGWIKSTDQTLLWLAKHRLAQCREISLSGWKNVTNNAVKELSELCPLLEVVNLSNCAKLTSQAVSALADNCHSLKDLDLSFISSDGVSTQSLKKVAEQHGKTLTSLNVAGNNLKGFHLTLNAIMECCPSLELLDVSNAIFSTDFLMLNVEKLQASCPALRILRLANCKVRGTNVSQRAQAEAPGFTRLTQLSCAVPGGDSVLVGGGVPDNLLQRLLHKAVDLQLLDLRGCTSFYLSSLLTCPAVNLSQLYLSQSSLGMYSDSLQDLALKWRHSLKVLDIAWTSPSPQHLEDAVRTLTECASCPLRDFSLAGTTVTLEAVIMCLERLSDLTSLDLTSCRSLPRGIKCLHQGKTALKKLLKTVKQI